MKTTSAHHRTTIISRNRHKQLILTSNLLKGRKINILHSSCWCQALYKLAFTNLSSVALTSVSHRRFPALSVGSLYYQGAAHMPAGLLLGPAQFSCFAHLVICTLSALGRCIYCVESFLQQFLTQPQNTQKVTWICAPAAKT